MHNSDLKPREGSSHVVWWPPRQAETPDIIVLFIPVYEKLIFTNGAILARAHLDHAPQKKVQILERLRRPPSHGLTIQIESAIEIFDSFLYNYTEKTIIVTALRLGYLCKLAIFLQPTWFHLA